MGMRVINIIIASKEDPRYLRMRMKIMVTYLDLLLVLDQDRIRPVDVYSSAHIHKMTFYKHYKTVTCIDEDIKNHVLCTFESIFERIESSDFHQGIKVFCKAAHEVIMNNKPFYTKLFDLGDRVKLVAEIRESIISRLKVFIAAKSILTNNEVEILIRFSVAGRAAVYKQLTDDKNAEFVESMFRILDKMSCLGYDKAK